MADRKQRIKIIYIVLGLFIYGYLIEVTFEYATYVPIKGYEAFFSIGWLGIGSLFTSMILLHNFKINSTIVLGIISFLLLGIFFSFLLHVLYPSNPLVIMGFPFQPILVSWITIGIILIIFAIRQAGETKKGKDLIKKVILESESKFSRLEIKEISERSKKDHNFIVNIIEEMIKLKEIRADYFKSSKSLLFDQTQKIGRGEGENDQKEENFKVYRFNRTKLFRLTYGSTAIFLIISIFAPFYFYYVPYNLYGDGIPFRIVFLWGFLEFIYGGWVGMFFIVVSFIFFLNIKTLYAIVMGIIGCVLIFFNFVYNLIYYFVPIRGYMLAAFFYTGFVSTFIILFYILYLTYIKMNPNEVHKSLIKKALLNIGTKYNRIELKEIAEYTHADLDLIVHVIKEMIKGEEIHADYFSTTKSVVFNLEANIDEIDELMLKFEEWEGKKIDKKE